MKIILFITVLALLPISFISLKAAKKQKKTSGVVYVTEVGLTDAEFKKINAKDAEAISAILSDAKKIKEAQERFAKLEELRNIATKSEAVNQQIFNDLAIVLGIFRGYRKYDEDFKTTHDNLQDALTRLVERIEITKASKKVKKAFAQLRDVVNNAIAEKAEILSQGGKIAKQTSVPKKEEVRGWFASVFIVKPAKPEKVQETGKKTTKKTKKAPKKSAAKKKKTEAL